MIKKIIACLTICFIITGIISPVFSDASALPQPNWSDPGISEIINISDLTGWMLNGGSFDVSTYTDAESFMNDYFNSRTQTKLISPSEDPQDDYYEVLPGFGINNQLVPGDSFARPLDTNRVIASSFRDHSGYGQRFSEQVNDALLSTGNLIDTKIPLLNQIEFANFVGYNHNALRLYSESFNNNDDSQSVNPDPQYQSYIDLCNGHGEGQFFWYDVPQTNSSYKGSTSINSYPATDYSWFKYPFQTNNFYPNSYITNMMQATDILTLYITFDGTNYNGVIYQGDSTIFSSIVSWMDYSYSMDGVDFSYDPNSDSFYMRSGANRNLSNLSCSYSNSDLASVLWFFSGLFRNINIYVDGVLWAQAGNIVIPPSINPEFPDAVGGEDLPSTTWPIFKPRAPYYTNVPGVLQAIEDAIADDGNLDLDDLKPYLTDENGDPVPDPIFDPEPVPIPVPDPVNPSIVPGLPILPAIPSDMPGFNGVSVLAEIINFTNQSLPTSLIVTFWGIVFGIVILGLIKILHK